MEWRHRGVGGPRWGLEGGGREGQTPRPRPRRADPPTPPPPLCSRQMLCVGGSHYPLGWSFLSIARVPCGWAPGDVWTADALLPAGARLEYKYVILEEQGWTRQTRSDAEGVVEYEWRSGGSAPAPPPAPAVVARAMAIVAWQPGANRVLAVPSEEELAALRPGVAVAREPARPRRARPFSTPPLPMARPPTAPGASSSSSCDSSDDDERCVVDQAGTTETLSLDADGAPVLHRVDVWGGGAPSPTRMA